MKERTLICALALVVTACAATPSRIAIPEITVSYELPLEKTTLTFKTGVNRCEFVGETRTWEGSHDAGVRADRIFDMCGAYRCGTTAALREGLVTLRCDCVDGGPVLRDCAAPE